MRPRSPSRARPHQASKFLGGVILTCIRAARVVFPAVVLLWLIVFSFAKNSSPQAPSKVAAPNSSLRGSTNAKAQALKKTTNSAASSRTAVTTQPNHAIIVAGHAVIRLNKMHTADRDDSSWYLLSYQKDQGFPSIITSHIRKGIDLAKKDNNAVLLFSGGQTRKDVGPLSEAASYYYLAEEKKWFGSINQRTYLEEYARDSFENLLFSICRFREVTGSYPAKVTVVGFDFKGHRFTELHRKAIGYPSGNFTYVGLRPEHPKFLHDRATSGELIAASQFRKNMYGCGDQSLVKKRTSRNPFRRTIPYELSCPEMKDLLHWCGPAMFDMDSVPWATHTGTVTPPHPHPHPESVNDHHHTSSKQDTEAVGAGRGGQSPPQQVPEIIQKKTLQKKREYDKKRLAAAVKT